MKGPRFLARMKVEGSLFVGGIESQVYYRLNNYRQRPDSLGFIWDHLQPPKTLFSESGIARNNSGPHYSVLLVASSCQFCNLSEDVRMCVFISFEILELSFLDPSKHGIQNIGKGTFPVFVLQNVNCKN